MTLVLPAPTDLDPIDRVEVAHPDDYLMDVDWATGFEFHSTDWTKR
jgi:hypothetical protein